MGLLKYLVGYGIMECLHTINAKNQAIRYANSLPNPKLNIGAAGVGQPIIPLATLNSGKKCDICPDKIKNIEYCELGKQLPYTNKEFNVVFASHVLEHIYPEQIRFAIGEMSRIGHKVIIVVPHPLATSNYLVPSHKSLIYKIDRPYGIYATNNSLQNTDFYEDHIYLDPDTFKIYQ